MNGIANGVVVAVTIVDGLTTAQWFTDFTERVGVPAAVMLVIVYLLYRAVKWSAKEVVVPVRDAHVRYMTKTEETMGRLAESNDKQTTLLEQMAGRDQGSDTKIGEIHSVTHKTHELVRGLAKRTHEES